ncbi:hypothetical protein BDA99DRAFT_447775, partial [Phascolomyces articulosus]
PYIPESKISTIRMPIIHIMGVNCFVYSLSMVDKKSLFYLRRHLILDITNLIDLIARTRSNASSSEDVRLLVQALIWITFSKYYNIIYYIYDEISWLKFIAISFL